MIYLSFNLHQIEQERRQLKADRIELSDVKYGFLSVDEWKKIASRIITKKITELDLQGADREELKTKITELLYQLMDDYEKNYRKEKSKSLGGFLQGVVADVTGTFGQMRKQIPDFTERIMEFIENPDHRAGIRAYILDQMEQYADATFQKIDYTNFNAVLSKHEAADKTLALANIDQAMIANKDQKEPVMIGLFLCIGIVIFFLLFNRNINAADVLLVTCICICLLILGIAMPMIDIDARIAQMKFTLLGEPVQFSDQVIFYRSKSILEVTQVMLSQGKWDIVFVGFLIFLFSVLFPSFKLIAGCAYAVKEKWRKQKLLQWVVFKTGKWSMADVMVVAVFMSYIGFTGILSEQLRQLDRISTGIEILSTNASKLQSGFFVFTAFVLISLVLAQKLQDRYSKDS